MYFGLIKDADNYLIEWRDDVLRFRLNGSIVDPVLEFYPTGAIFVNGKEIASDIEILNGFKVFLNLQGEAENDSIRNS